MPLKGTFLLLLPIFLITIVSIRQRSRAYFGVFHRSSFVRCTGKTERGRPFAFATSRATEQMALEGLLLLKRFGIPPTRILEEEKLLLQCCAVQSASYDEVGID